MPNWCCNFLTITGPNEDLQRLQHIAQGVNPWPPVDNKINLLNFHSLWPIPEYVLSAAYHDVGRTWEVQNWGCKWGACQTELMRETPTELRLEFDTAWSPPILLLRNIAPLWPALRFHLKYEEPMMDLAGEVTVYRD